MCKKIDWDKLQIDENHVTLGLHFEHLRIIKVMVILALQIDFHYMFLHKPVTL